MVCAEGDGIVGCLQGDRIVLFAEGDKGLCGG